jgi:hypothetical protein
MPRVGCNSTTPTPCAGPSTPKTNPFDLLLSIRGNSNVEWESDAESDRSSRLDYSSHYDSDDNLIANSMLLPIFASGGGEEKKPKKKKGKGKRLPAPEKKLALTTTSLGGSSKLPVGDVGPKQ